MHLQSPINMNTNYISIKQVLDDVLDHPLLKDLTLERAVNYSVEFMRIMGSPTTFEECTEVIELQKYKALLPCNFHRMIQVRTVENFPKVLRYATDSFHNSPRKSSSVDATYKIQGNVLIASIPEGKLEVVYESIAVDKDGFPLIPDNSSYIRALEAYIKKRYFTILFDLGKIHYNVLEVASQDYAWAAGDCHSEFNRMSLDQAETFYNAWSTLILRANEHSKGFVNLGAKEHIKIK